MKLMRCLTSDRERQNIRKHAHYGWILVSRLLLGLLLGLLPGTAAAQESLCAEVKIEIAQELTLERQAFEAHMRINNGLSHITLEDVQVTVRFTDEDGHPVEATSNPDSSTASFFIRLDSTEHLGDLQIAPNHLDFSGTVNPSTSADIYWLIIPAPGASDGVPQGKLYYVGATLSYTLGGEEHVTEVSPDYIFVKPMPQLQLDYFLPHEVYGDDAFTPEIEPPQPFSLGVRVSNTGSGTASNLAIESAQPKIVDNEQGLLIDFVITGSEVNGADATPSLLVDFGDIAPDSAGVARWSMECSLSGEFSELTAEISHADELGGNLTALITDDDVHTHVLVHDVLVDLPGRDSIRDFLATENPFADTIVYTVYESENTDSSVTDLSASATLTPVEGLTDAYTLAFVTPVIHPLHTVTLPDPTDGAQVLLGVTRSDGKVIPPANVWISTTRNDQHGWNAYVHLFDSLATPLPSCSYTLVFADPLHTQQPPVLQSLPDRSGVEGEPLSFPMEASCSGHTDVCVPALSAAPLPAGAAFSDREDGTAIFDWTPATGQAGVYTMTVQARDGDLAATQDIRLTIWTDQPIVISGYVWASDGITGLQGVVLDGFPVALQTNEMGYYRGDVAPGWSGTVIPHKAGYTFIPTVRTYHEVLMEQAAQDYTGTAPQYTLTVEITGEGRGLVTGDGGINCGTVCSAMFTTDTLVSFSAIPDAGSLFGGAEGADCTDEGLCTLTLGEETRVMVTFSPDPNSLPTPTPGPQPTPTSITPIPEPGTMILLGLGILGLLGLQGYFRKRKS